MARFYVPLDVNYQLDDKIMCAGHVAECLYVRALAYAKRAGTEGRIKHSQLRALALGLPGQPPKHAAALVGVGLWEAVGDEYYITGWLNHNLTNAALIEQKAMIRRKSILGNHKRHHVAKGVTDDDCEICSPPHGEQNISPRGGQTLPIEENRTEPKKNRTELNRTEPKRNETSSSPGEPDTDHGLPANDDDDGKDFVRAINILVEHKAYMNPPDNRVPWELTTNRNTISENGDEIRRELAKGKTPVEAAGVVLKSRSLAELAERQLP